MIKYGIKYVDKNDGRTYYVTEDYSVSTNPSDAASFNSRDELKEAAHKALVENKYMIDESHFRTYWSVGRIRGFAFDDDGSINLNQSRKSIKSGWTFRNAVNTFKEESGRFNDYWEMQQAWEAFKDNLTRDGEISQRQSDNWGNPCTPETFARWNGKEEFEDDIYSSRKSIKSAVDGGWEVDSSDAPKALQMWVDYVGEDNALEDLAQATGDDNLEEDIEWIARQFGVAEELEDLDSIWEKHEELRQLIGTHEYFENLHRAMGYDELAACLAFIFRQNDFQQWDDENGIYQSKQMKNLANVHRLYS